MLQVDIYLQVSAVLLINSIFGSCRSISRSTVTQLFFIISEMFWPSLLMSSLAFAVVQSMQQCRSTYSKRGHYLKDHVISSENVENIGVCYIKCSKDRRCKSINFHIDNLLCELNDADRFTHPWDYVLKKDHAYAYCPGKVCVRIFPLCKLNAQTFSSNNNNSIFILRKIHVNVIKCTYHM